MSLEELVDWIACGEKTPKANPGEWTISHPTIDGQGVAVSVQMRLCIKKRWHIPETWTCAVVMYGIRVDGIDHHTRPVLDMLGRKCHGWHRHGWSSIKNTADGYYECLPSFGPIDTLEEFVQRCCDELGFNLKEGG